MPTFDRLVTPVVKLKALANAAITTPVNGVAIDLKGVVSLSFLLYVTAYTSGTLSAKIQLSADGSTGWTDLDAKYQVPETLVGVAAVDTALSIGLSGMNNQTFRYARVVTVNTVALSVVGIALIQYEDR